MTHPTGPAGGGPGGASGTSPKVALRSIVGGLVVSFLAIALIATSMNPKLLAPTVMVVGFASGIYAIHLYARRRRMS